MSKEKRAEYMKAYRKANSENLTDTYIKGLLKMPFTKIPDGLIAAKRGQIELHRALGQLKQVLTEKADEEKRGKD